MVQTQETNYRILKMAGGEPVDMDTSSVGAGAELLAFTGNTP
ncbi:hypothetical protein ACFV0D_00410 [Streptomyces sp. NPDC059556]